MAEEELPFGELGDLMEQLVPIAARLVQAVHPTEGEGPDVIRGVLAALPEAPASMRLPHGTADALCIVLAAMVNENAGVRSLLGWTDDLIEPGLAAQRRQAHQRAADAEGARLAAANVRSVGAIATLAAPVAQAQESSPDRMLRIVHGGRESA